MKIVRIFANKLFAFQFEGDDENEYDRLMTLWTDPSYLREFLKEHSSDLPSGMSVNEAAILIYEDGERMDVTLKTLAMDKERKMASYFRPLHNQEYRSRGLSKQKAKKNCLRLYALRIDDDCFVITGGAIKLTRLMEERAHTKQELAKLDRARSFLKEQGVMGQEAFFELIIELHDEE